MLLVAGEVVALDVGEVVEDAGGGWRGAGAVFVVERQFGDAFAVHRGAELALDQRAAQQGDEVAGEQRFDAGWAVERDGGGGVDGLELVVALFEVGLVAVGGQDLGVGERVVVADQREQPSEAASWRTWPGSIWMSSA